MMVVWKIRGKISELFCAVLCTTVVLNDTHTREQLQCVLNYQSQLSGCVYIALSAVRV